MTQGGQSVEFRAECSGLWRKWNGGTGDGKCAALLRTWVRRGGRGEGRGPAGDTGSGRVPSGEPGEKTGRLRPRPGQLAAAAQRQRPWQWRWRRGRWQWGHGGGREGQGTGDAPLGDDRWCEEKQAGPGATPSGSDSETEAGRGRGESALPLGGSRAPGTRLPSPPPRRGCRGRGRGVSPRGECSAGKAQRTWEQSGHTGRGCGVQRGGAWGCWWERAGPGLLSMGGFRLGLCPLCPGSRNLCWPQSLQVGGSRWQLRPRRQWQPGQSSWIHIVFI